MQFKEWDGSLHSRAHVDPLYRVFADRAREEGGEPLYRFCSGCHAAVAVASGEIPGDKSQKPTFHTDEGVSCVVCHAVQRFNTVHAGGGANGSIVLEAGDVMYGPIADPTQARLPTDRRHPRSTASPSSARPATRSCTQPMER